MSTLTQPLQEAFNAGEFGQRMESRVQFDKYPSAGSTYQNVLALPQGGFSKRPGLRFIQPVHTSTVRSWLIPFVYSTTQAYVLELGEQSLRFFRNQAQIGSADTDAAIANGSFPSGITSWTARNSGTGAIAHDATNLDLDLNANGAGNEARAFQSIATTATGVEHVIKFKIVGDAGDEITVRVGSSSGASDYLSDSKRKAGWHTIQFTPAASPFFLEFENGQAKTISIDDIAVVDNAAVEIPTPWAEDSLPLLSYAQSADVIYFCLGGSTRVYRLDRYGHSAWGLTKTLFEDGPFLTENTTSTTFTPSATSGNGITVTASAVTGVNDGAGFRATDVGRLIRIKDAANNWTWLQIVGISSSTVVTADVKGDALSSTAARTTWRMGEYNDTDGWPAVVSFVQQRLALAATTAQPQKFWMSKSADIENFQDETITGDVEDDSSIVYRFAARQVNTIRWITSRSKPIVGTQGGEWTLNSSGEVLTPTDIAATFEVSGGVAQVPPVEIRSRLLFIRAQSRKLIEFADVIQNNGQQGFDEFDLTILNDRILKGGAQAVQYQQEPDSTLWMVREDGQVPTLTYQPEQDVIGWARQVAGGSFQGGNAVVESVACIPGQNGVGQFKDSSGRHEVWMVVKRTINGSTVRYIECLEKTFIGDEDLQEDAFYVDSGLTLDNPVTITGVTQASPGVVTAANHGFVNGDIVRIVRVKGMTELNGNSYKVANNTTNTFELNDEDDNLIDTTTDHSAYITGGEVRKKVSTISGLSHLEGETVNVFADGAVQTQKTVSSGSITLDDPASLVHVGLPYEWRWKSLKLAVGARNGTAVGKPKNIADIVLVLMETAEGALSVATIEDGVEGVFSELDLRDATDLDDAPVAFFSGEIRLGVAAGFDDDIRILLKGTTPVPLTVTGVSPEVETSS